MPKYPILEQLEYWLDNNMLSPDLDLAEVFSFWAANHGTKLKKKPSKSKNQPRFYARAMASNRRAKQKGDNNFITADDLEVVYARDKGQCKLCPATDKLVFDHIVSYYKGGTNTIDNLQLLCVSCNMEKGVN